MGWKDWLIQSNSAFYVWLSSFPCSNTLLDRLFHSFPRHAKMFATFSFWTEHPGYQQPCTESILTICNVVEQISGAKIKLTVYLCVMDASYGRRDTATMLLSALSGWYKSGPDRKTALKRKFTKFRKVGVIGWWVDKSILSFDANSNVLLEMLWAHNLIKIVSVYGTHLPILYLVHRILSLLVRILLLLVALITYHLIICTK